MAKKVITIKATVTPPPEPEPEPLPPSVYGDGSWYCDRVIDVCFELGRIQTATEYINQGLPRVNGVPVHDYLRLAADRVLMCCDAVLELPQDEKSAEWFGRRRQLALEWKEWSLAT